MFWFLITFFVCSFSGHKIIHLHIIMMVNKNFFNCIASKCIDSFTFWMNAFVSSFHDQFSFDGTAFFSGENWFFSFEKYKIEIDFSSLDVVLIFLRRSRYVIWLWVIGSVEISVVFLEAFFLNSFYVIQNFGWFYEPRPYRINERSKDSSLSYASAYLQQGYN